MLSLLFNRSNKFEFGTANLSMPRHVIPLTKILNINGLSLKETIIRIDRDCQIKHINFNLLIDMMIIISKICRMLIAIDSQRLCNDPTVEYSYEYVPLTSNLWMLSPIVLTWLIPLPQYPLPRIHLKIGF